MKYYIPIVPLLLFPLASFAQGQPTDFASFVVLIFEVTQHLIPIILGLTFIIFIWGLMQAWILNPGDESKIEAGKGIAVAGIIGFVVMIAVWGIVAMLQSAIT